MKTKKSGRSISRYKKNSSYSPISSKLGQKEFVKLEKAKELLLEIKKRYKLTFDEIKELLKEELSFPVDILNKKLTVLESVVKYLKEERKFSLRKISGVLKRDERNVWHVYDKAKKKYPKKFIVKKSEIYIPISIFHDRRLSVLEAIVVYLKDSLSLTYHQIAVLLSRDDRTIWTCYSRAKKKL